MEMLKLVSSQRGNQITSIRLRRVRKKKKRVFDWGSRVPEGAKV